MNGEVIWFSGPKSYGFISRDDGEADVFVHWSEIIGMEGYKTLKQGQRVSFEIGSGPKNKPQACKVKIIED